MNIETVTYFKTFPIGACWEKIGVSVKINEGESLTDILNQAKKEVETWHIDSNPQIYTGGVRTIPDGSEVVVKQERPKDQAESIIFDIENCDDLIVLESYNLISKTNPSIKKAYDNQLARLQM